MLGTSVANTGSLNYTDGRISGEFERWINATETNYLFPIGTTTTANIATIRFISGLTSGSLVVKFDPSTPGTSGIPVNDGGVIVDNVFTEGYWRFVAKNALASTEYNVTLNGNGFSSHTFNATTRVLKRTAGGSWFAQGTHIAPTGTACTRNTLNGLSTINTDFCLGALTCIGGTVGDNITRCSGDDLPAFVNYTPPTGGTSYTYVWQLTTNMAATAGDTNWTDIPSSNGLIHNYGTLSTTAKFIRKADTSGCPTVYSNEITVTINPTPATGPIYRKPNGD
jgi:hypothetical protein